MIKHAIGLLSQQVWCWGQDIMRPEGNWLLEIGFERTAPPASRQSCPSIYQMNLPGGKWILLRGFGVFFGDPSCGSVFLHRYEFVPQFLNQGTLRHLPWNNADLPRLRRPTESQRPACTSLILHLIDWIRDYEVNIVDRLGVEYRQSTLIEWDDGKQPCTPAEDMAGEWRRLGISLAENPTFWKTEHNEKKEPRPSTSDGENFYI